MVFLGPSYEGCGSPLVITWMGVSGKTYRNNKEDSLKEGFRISIRSAILRLSRYRSFASRLRPADILA